MSAAPDRFAPPEWVRALAEPSLEARLEAPRRAAPSPWADLLAESKAWASAKPAADGDPKGYRWEHDHPLVTPAALALGERTRASLARGKPSDPEVECAWLVLARLASPSKAEDLPLRALLHWAGREGPGGGAEEAVDRVLRARTLRTYGEHLSLRGTRPLFFQLEETPRPLDRGELVALRRALRTFERAPLARRLEAALATGSTRDEAALAWLLDDAARADALVREAASTEARAELALLVGLVSRVEDAIALTPGDLDADEALQADARRLGRDEALRLHRGRFADPGPEGGAFVRAALRHGLAYAPTALARAALDPRGWAPVLACYPSPAAAEALVAMLPDKTVRVLVGRALAAMPAHARPALEAALASRPRHADVLEALLRA